MNDILFSMVTEYESGAHRSNAEAMRAALLWLADNVSDEMADARITELNIDDVRSTHRSAISAALRAAAGSALEAKP